MANDKVVLRAGKHTPLSLLLVVRKTLFFIY